MSNRRESTAADIISWERALNGAILTADISRGYEEYLEIFDRFYAEDIRLSARTRIPRHDLASVERTVSRRRSPFCEG